MTYYSVVTVLASVGLTKKSFGHYAILKILSLRLPSTIHVLTLKRGGHFDPLRFFLDNSKTS